mmetsp:Transcript_8424/g.19742  ORF Transcript_8424/g.19742 Transcript_8424/m.19742 type:complete len:233 (-) Transcript_8424:119-817(-)
MSRVAAALHVARQQIAAVPHVRQLVTSCFKKALPEHPTRADHSHNQPMKQSQSPLLLRGTAPLLRRSTIIPEPTAASAQLGPGVVCSSSSRAGPVHCRPSPPAAAPCYQTRGARSARCPRAGRGTGAALPRRPTRLTTTLWPPGLAPDPPPPRSVGGALSRASATAAGFRVLPCPRQPPHGAQGAAPPPRRRGQPAQGHRPHCAPGGPSVGLLPVPGGLPGVPRGGPPAAQS